MTSAGSRKPTAPQPEGGVTCANCGRELPKTGGYVDISAEKMFCSKHCLFESRNHKRKEAIEE